MKDYKNIKYSNKKERISFEDKHIINDAISELIKLGYSEEEARVKVTTWIKGWD